MIPTPISFRAGTSCLETRRTVWFKVNNVAMDSLLNDEGDDLLHEKPVMMDIDTVASVPPLSPKEESSDQQDVRSELRSLAAASMEGGDFEGAEEIFRNLLHLESQKGQDNDSVLVATLASIGKCCESTGRLQEALSCYKEALQMRTHRELQNEPTEMQLLLASVLYDIGMIHSKVLFKGKSEITNRNRDVAAKATKAFSLALKLRQNCLGENHPAHWCGDDSGWDAKPRNIAPRKGLGNPADGAGA
jgi:tetratricopeptide (TPR) repeat protein